MPVRRGLRGDCLRTRAIVGRRKDAGDAIFPFVEPVWYLSEDATVANDLVPGTSTKMKRSHGSSLLAVRILVLSATGAPVAFVNWFVSDKDSFLGSGEMRRVDDARIPFYRSSPKRERLSLCS